MTMLKTYRKRRKRLRGYFTYGFDYDPRTMEVTAYVNGKPIAKSPRHIIYPEGHIETFIYVVTKTICPQCNKPLDSGELLSCERCGTKACGSCPSQVLHNFATKDGIEKFICEKCFQKDCEKEDNAT